MGSSAVHSLMSLSTTVEDRLGVAVVETLEPSAHGPSVGLQEFEHRTVGLIGRGKDCLRRCSTCCSTQELSADAPSTASLRNDKQSDEVTSEELPWGYCDVADRRGNGVNEILGQQATASRQQVGNFVPALRVLDESVIDRRHRR